MPSAPGVFWASRESARLQLMAQTTANKPKILIDEAHLRAHLQLDAKADHTALEEQAILVALTEAGVVISEQITARVEALCEQARAGELSGDEFLIAEGVEPKPPVDAVLHLDKDLCGASDTPAEKEEDQDSIDYYAQCKLLTVTEGTVIGVVQPSRPAVEGTDLMDKPIRAAGTPIELTLGSGLTFADDGKTLLATTNGLVQHRADSIDIIELVQIDGDVDLDSGSLDVDLNVMVKGTVRDLFSVKTTKSLSVGGAIENSTVEAGADIAVKGGIAGKEKGLVRAGGNVVCRFCQAATIETGGDITITKEAINSQLRAAGQLFIPRGPLISGQAHARGGAEIKVIGSEGEVPTRLIVGIDPVILAKAARIDCTAEKRRVGAKKIRAAVEPLIANLKRLAPAQRERATELMFEADTVEAGADDLTVKKEKMIEEASWHEQPVLTVTDRIHPGVTLIFEDLEFTAREVLRGPIRISKQQAGEGTPAALICTNTVSGAKRELLCRKYTAEIPEENETDSPEKVAQNAVT